MVNVRFLYAPKCVFFGQPEGVPYLAVKCDHQDYLPPEVLKGESSSEKHDIWSAGLCFYAAMILVE